MNQGSYASYVGLRASDFRATKNHAWKIGFDVNRENATAYQEFACYYVDCKSSGTVATPYYPAFTTPQGQAGSQIGIYGEDHWQRRRTSLWSYGLRYDPFDWLRRADGRSARASASIVWDGGKNVAHVYYGRFYAAPLLEDVRQACVLLSAQQACTTTNPVYDLKPESDAYFEMGDVYLVQSALHGFGQPLRKERRQRPRHARSSSIRRSSPSTTTRSASITASSFASRIKSPAATNGSSPARFRRRTRPASRVRSFSFRRNPVGISCQAQLSLEDHSQTVDSTAAYTHRFGGPHKLWYTTLQANYGSGFPVQFEDANVNLNGTLPAHTTFDFSLGRDLTPGRPGEDQGLGLSLQVLNLLNHQYVIKVANGFNTTQIANSRSFLLRLTAPF